jgi:hypothetical protein
MLKTASTIVNNGKLVAALINVIGVLRIGLNDVSDLRGRD